MTRRAALLGVLFLAAWASATDSRSVVPTYSAHYTEDAVLREILLELRAIRAELKALRPSTTPAPTLGGILKARCASCHGQSVAAGKGDGLVLVESDGNIPDFNRAERRLILRLVATGEMPKKGPPLSEPEKRALTEHLTPPEK